MDAVNRTLKDNISLFLMIIAVVIIMGFANGGRYFSAQNLYSMAYQLPIIGLLSIGMMISILTGGINLSLIATANLNGIIIAITLAALSDDMATAQVPVILFAMLLGIAACTIVGIVNGLLISVLKIPDILVTLGTMSLVSGLNVVLTRGYTLSGFPPFLLAIGNSSVLGIPTALIVFLIACVIAALILNRTKFGYCLYMAGSNQTATYFSGISLVKVIVLQYIFSSAFAILCSWIMIGQLNSVKASYADSYLLVAILACFLGRVNPFGGFGTVFSMVLAVIILQLISSGLNLMRTDPFAITATWGAAIVVILLGKLAAEKITMKKKASGA